MNKALGWLKPRCMHFRLGRRDSKEACLRRRSASGFLIPILSASALFLAARASLAENPTTPQSGGTNAFPDPVEVLGGRTFANPFEREVYFLKRIREAYPSYWGPLLSANILVNEYVVAPARLQKFIEELGEAAHGTDDRVAITNLAAVTSSPDFYANTNTFRPEILRSTAVALIKMGPHGRQALADSFNEPHYRRSPESLEVLAQSLGQLGIDDPKLKEALAATAFSFATTNGGSFPNCTQAATRALLHIPGGIEAVRQHLKENEVFDDPSRFQDVVMVIQSEGAAALRSDLVRIESAVKAKLAVLKTSAADPASARPYIEELSKLDAQLGRAIETLRRAVSPEPN